MGYLSKRKFIERERILSVIMLVLLPFSTLYSLFFNGINFSADHIGEFKIQILVLCILMCIWCIIKKHYYEMCAYIIVMIINITVIASHYKFINGSNNLPEDSFSFTFMYQDLKYASRHDIIKIQETLDNYNSDIVLWTNVPADIYREINNFKGNYALQNQTYDTKGKMQLILSKTPGTSRGLIGENNGIWVSRIVGERKISIVLTSQNSPWKSKESYNRVKNNINELAYFVKNRDEPVVIFGGFRASAWSKLLRPLETKAELSTSGFTLLYAENLYYLLTKRIINSIFVHPGIAVSEIMKLPKIGKTKPGIAGTIKIAPIRKEIQFLELEPTVSEEYLLQQSN